jgi:hypothetical protein
VSDQREFLRAAFPTLAYVQDYGPASIICGLFMSVAGAAQDDTLQECREMLAKIASWAAGKREPIPVFYAFLGYIGRDVEEDVKCLSPEQQREVRALTAGALLHHPGIHRYDSSPWTRLDPGPSFTYSDVERTALRELDCYAKTQLQFSLREFTQDDLQKLLVQFAEAGDAVGVFRVVRSAKARKCVLTIGRLLLPLETIPAVIFYLVAMRSDELPALLARLRQHENDFEIETAIRAATFKEFMTDTGPIRKSELRRICQIWNRFNVGDSVDRQMLFDFPIQKLSAAAEKPRKLAFVVVFIGLLLSSVTSMPTTFPAALLLNLHLFWSSLPPAVLSRTLEALADRCVGMRAANDVVGFVDAFAATLYPRSPAYASSLRIIARLGRPQNGVSNSSACFLNSLIPSLFVAGLRLFDELFQALPEGSHGPLLREALPLAIANFSKFSDLPGVSEAFSLPLAAVLLRDNLGSFHRQIITAMPTILVSHSRACFGPLAFTVRIAIRACPNTSPDIRFLADVADSLDTEPACMSLIVPALQMLRERAYKAETSREREAFVIEKVTHWFQRSARFDCVSMPDVIYEWAKALQDTIGFAHASSFICYQLLKYVRRFFPVFATMARFVGKGSTSDDHDLVVQRLEEAAILNQCRVHAVATILLARRRGRIACDLACFERDCEESDQILSGNPELRDILATLT